jgi:hypothetical protein
MWQIFPYRQFQDERVAGRLIFGGNVVRLKHAESGGYICLDDEGKLASGDTQGYLRIYTGAQTGENADEHTSTNCLFEIEYDVDSEHGKATMWEDEKSAAPVNYRFRHLNSGRVLTVNPLSKNGKEIFVLTSSQVLGNAHVLSQAQRQAAGGAKDDPAFKEFNR